MKSLFAKLRRHRLAQRLRYEVIYCWPGWRNCSAFNVGHWPVEPGIANDPAFAAEPNQIQLYAELIKTAGLTPAEWKRAAVLEIAAGRGGGLAYIQKTFAPAALTGLDISRSAVRHGRRRGLPMIAGYAHRLRLPDQSFDVVLSLDALTHLADREAIVREARRVLKPNGLYLVGDFILAPVAQAREHAERLAAAGGFRVRTFRDVTPGVVASLVRDRERKAALVQRLPGFIRAGLAETVTLEGTARYREWQSGARSYFMTVLAPLA